MTDKYLFFLRDLALLLERNNASIVNDGDDMVQIVIDGTAVWTGYLESRADMLAFVNEDQVLYEQQLRLSLT